MLLHAESVLTPKPENTDGIRIFKKWSEMEYLMKTIGIIAEYNPFHNGHAYQIDRVKTKNKMLILSSSPLSGDFVQRGAPAIIDKYCRAEMALLCGADLVIELPAVWAVSSAEDFAWQVLPCLIKWAVSTGYALEQNPTSSPA